jgi:hypothetical protein
MTWLALIVALYLVTGVWMAVELKLAPLMKEDDR